MSNKLLSTRTQSYCCCYAYPSLFVQVMATPMEVMGHMVTHMAMATPMTTPIHMATPTHMEQTITFSPIPILMAVLEAHS